MFMLVICSFWASRSAANYSCYHVLFFEGCGNVYARPLDIPVVDPTADNRKCEGAEMWLKVALVSLCAIAVIVIVS